MKKLAHGIVWAFAAMSAASAFAAGTLPAGYTEVEYIQGDGSNARIVTDYTPNPSTDKIELEVEWPANTLGVNQAIWCARGSDTTVNTWTMFMLGKDGNNQLRFDYKSTVSAFLTPAVSVGTKYTVTVDRNAATWTGGNGYSHPVVSGFTAAGGPAMLFASYTNGTGNNLGNYGKQKLYSFKVWRSGDLIHYFVPCKDSGGAATMADICDDPATLTKSGTFTAGQEGHYYDDSLFTIDDDTLVIAGSSIVGSPSPAYGKQTGLAAGDTVAVSCGATVVTNGTTECICKGWRLRDAAGNILSTGTDTSFTYIHPSPAKGRKLEWQWKLRPVGADVTDLLPTLRLTFDEQSLANTGSGTFTKAGGTLVYVESPSGYALDVSQCAPYGTLSGVFAANRDSAIAIVATLGVKPTGVILHFKNGNTSIMLRRGASDNQIVLTENNSSSPLITVNDIDNGDTEYHLYVVNILQSRVDLYVDGELAGTTATTPRAADLVNWQFGGRHGGVISGEVVCSGQIDDLRVYASALDVEQMTALADSFGVGSALAILPIPDQINETFNACCPEFVVSNKDTSATYTIGGNIASPLFDVAYINNIGVGKATVTATGKGEYAGEKLTAKFNIVATKLEDENISTLDISVKRHIVDGKYVYVFTDAASDQVVTAKRNLAMTDCLLVGGGGAGGGKTGGGGGAGGVTNAANLGASAFVAKNGTFTVTVGAGGTHNNNPQSKGGNGGTTSIVFGEFSASVAGGGGGGSWNNGGGVAGASGGGGSQNAAGGAGTAGIGNAGATGLGVNTCRSGGGGGAGHAGYQADTTANHSGYGGEGVSNNITGAWVVYGGGGGGGGGKGGGDSTTLTPGLGGLGGGGNGGSSANNGNGNPGTDGLGGGGGGGNIGGNGNNGGRGGQGGSGTVILVVNPNDLEVELTDQVWESFDPCRPELTVSNAVNGAHWTVGGDIASEYFDVEYVNNVGVGTARVDITGKGDCAGLSWSGSFDILATKYEDANITTTDLTAKRLEVDGRYVYVFTNTVSAQTVTANRMIALDEFLLVGGGGGGGRTRGGGGGAGGVTNAAGVVGIALRKNETFTLAVGAGGAGGANESYAGGKGGDTALEFGLFAVTVPGGGGGAGWGIKTGAKGGSGGGGANGAAGGAGYSGFGFAGAASLGGNNRSGGGGGAGHAGYRADETANRAGNGGEGVSNRITGAWIVYGGGGGAGGSNNGYYNPAAGLGGLGGGGDGSKGIDGNPGTDGLGGGGGGGGYGGGPSGYSSTYSGLGGNGGSGIAILAIKATDFMVDPIPDQVLAGGVSEPLPVVRTADGETLLAKDKDYTVSYKDNDKGGIATVTITGINGYAGKSIELFFKITSRIYAKPSVASEGDGTSWANAMSAAKAFETLAHASGYNEIWMQEGTVFQPAFSVTNSGALVIRGGFAGTETTLEDRQPGAFTVFNGENTATVLLRVSDVLAADTVIDRVKFYRAKNNGLVKTGGGTIRVYDCVVEANGSGVKDVWGRGMNMQSDGGGSLVVSNCVFAGNRCTATDTQYGGFGLYVKSFKDAVVDNSLFVTNGYDIRRAETPSGGGWDYCGFHSKGSAALVIDTPITVRNSRFAGNCCPLRKSLSVDSAGSGGALTLTGASGGSRVENCVFVGNIDRRSQGMEGDDGTGALAVYLNGSTAKVSVDNCTFAYNITAGSKSAGGITILRGSADIKNTIFWKNRRYHLTLPGYGTDVQVHSSGSANISHSLVTDLDGTALGGANLAVDADSVFAGDPRLVTTTDDFESQLAYTDTTVYYDYTRASRYEDLASIDVHLLSAAGYCVNGGAVGPATALCSPAIDLGDPDADYANEPVPNGGRLNLGAYGNTAEASLSPTGQPEATVAVVFPDGEARPAAQVTMGLASGSGSGYLATVHVICSTGGVTLVEEVYHQVANGDVLETRSPLYLPPGVNFDVSVTITAPNAQTTNYNASAPVSDTYTYPPYYGKGGGPKVIHVRTGADGLQDGSNWEHAYPDLRTALATAPDASKTEIWLSVTNDYTKQQVALVGSLTVRGGFAGVENFPEERPEGLQSTLDGISYTYRGLDFSVPSGALLTVERIRFAHASQSELKKTGAGDLLVHDCYFTEGRKNDGSLKGGGIYATGGTVAITNCQFMNLLSNGRSYAGYGGDGIFLESCKQAYVDSCLFVTNGYTFYKNKGLQAKNSGVAAFVASTSAVFSNCRFASCCAAMLDANSNGGTIYFSGTSSGSKLINCVFTGNTDFEHSQSGNGITQGGTIAVAMSTTNATLDIENCTVAYNLTQGYSTGAGINIIKGTVNVKNSIVYGNVRGRQTDIAGADIEVKANGLLDIRYSLVTGLTSNYVHAVNSENLTIGPGVISGVDPLLATTTNDFSKLFTADGAGVYIAQVKRGDCAKIDVHPRTRTGYIKDGVLIRDPERVESPTIDKGDPTSDYSKEPQLIGIGGNGGRVNLGFSGNTPEAALTRRTGSVYYIR